MARLAPLDDEHIAVIATVASLLAAVFSVLDVMAHGYLATAQHLGIALAAFTGMRYVLGRSLRPAPARATTTPPAPTP